MNTKAFLSKLSNVAVMARNGATAGERAAGRAAIGRLLERARAETDLMRIAAAQQFWGDVVSLARSAGVSVPTPVAFGAAQDTQSDWRNATATGGMANRNSYGATRPAGLDMYL